MKNLVSLLNSYLLKGIFVMSLLEKVGSVEESFSKP